ncbi:MAG: presqualene diphosphate synthase HpnD [Betaproteobacteria bacterium]|nr:presqualene diphosphate synthase HpnD [Betaproteobacteria bacterium]
MSPHEYCRSRALQSGSSFYYSFLFLPEERRRAIIALYAFCREVDDVVDELTDLSVARMKLAWWRTEVEAVFGGSPQHPVARALLDVVGPFGLQRAHLDEIIDGMEMDLDHGRYPDFAALRVYCHRVAGVVGLLSATIFGYREAQTLEYAHDLGIAFQLTNIIRDVGEDARRERIYLPQEDLARYGVSDADIMAGRTSANMRDLMRFQVARARSFYSQALGQLPSADRRAQRAGLVMAAIYQRLLDEIEADACQVLNAKISLTPVTKLWLAWKTWLTA